MVPGQEEAYRAYLTTTAKKVYQEMMAVNAKFPRLELGEDDVPGHGTRVGLRLRRRRRLRGPPLNRARMSTPSP